MPPVGADDVIIRTQAGARTGGDGLLTDVGMQVAGDLPGGVHLEGFLLAPADPEHLLVDAQKGRGAFEGGPLAALARRLRGGRPNTCIQGPPFSWPLALYSLPKEMSHIYLNLYRGQPRHNRRAAMGGSVTISPRCGRIDRLEPLDRPDTRVRVFDLMRPPQLERVFPAVALNPMMGTGSCQAAPTGAFADEPLTVAISLGRPGRPNTSHPTSASKPGTCLSLGPSWHSGHRRLRLPRAAHMRMTSFAHPWWGA